MERDAVVRHAWEAFEPELARLGLELVEVEYSGQTLRVFLDKMDRRGGGITLDDCTAASQMLGALLDADDCISARYMLEVSSPGVERPLRKVEHFARHVGEEVRVVTQTPCEGRRRFQGTLEGIGDGLVRVNCAGSTVAIHLENIKKANLVAQW